MIIKFFSLASITAGIFLGAVGLGQHPHPEGLVEQGVKVVSTSAYDRCIEQNGIVLKDECAAAYTR